MTVLLASALRRSVDQRVLFIFLCLTVNTCGTYEGLVIGLAG